MRFQGCPAAVSENEPIKSTGFIRGVGKRWARQSVFWRDRLVRGARRPARASSASQPLSSDLPASWEGQRESSARPDGVFFLSSAVGDFARGGERSTAERRFISVTGLSSFPSELTYAL